MTRFGLTAVLLLLVSCKTSDVPPADSATALSGDTLVSLDAPGSKNRPFAVGAPAESATVAPPINAASTDPLEAFASSLIVPVQGVTVPQLRDTYTEARQGHTHEALDILALRGTPVLAATDGIVTQLHNSAAGGLMVYAGDATDRFVLMYGHLDRYADGLLEGARLTRGQVIGYVGTTGNAPVNTPHLHFAIARGQPSVAWWKGAPVNPYDLFTGHTATVATKEAPVVVAPDPAPSAAIATPAAPVAPKPGVSVIEPLAHYTLSSAEAKKAIATKAQAVIGALAAHDMVKLAALADPAKGVRFSPYAHVDKKADRLIRKETIKTIWPSKTVSVWGTHDGSGAPIRLTYAEYHKAFVYDYDFAKAKRVEFNADPIGRGNTINNIATSYPNAIVVEYHSPGTDPKLEGMDWRSLWLVFEKTGATWYLVGIVHGSWTI